MHVCVQFTCVWLYVSPARASIVKVFVVQPLDRCRCAAGSVCSAELRRDARVHQTTASGAGTVASADTSTHDGGAVAALSRRVGAGDWL